jgi:hypothetical protein
MLRIVNGRSQVGELVLPDLENFPQILEFCTNPFGTVHMLNMGIPTLLHDWDEVLMIKPIVLKPENLWFGDLG